MLLHLLVREALAHPRVQLVQSSHVFLWCLDAARCRDGSAKAAGKNTKIGDTHGVELAGQRLSVSLASGAQYRIAADLAKDVVLALAMLR